MDFNKAEGPALAGALRAMGIEPTEELLSRYSVINLVHWKRLEKGQITEDPILTQVSAVSAGIVDGRPVLDLNYVEDSGSDTDMNVVMTGEGRFVEIQGTAEGAVFSRAELDELLRLAEKGNLEIMTLQRAAFE